MVMVAVFADSANEYPLTIGYRSPYGVKKNKIFVNGADLGYAHYPQTETFAEFPFDAVPFAAGTNTVQFLVSRGGDGWMDVDYFDIKGLSPQAMNPVPKYNASAFPGTRQLSWTNPEPGPGDLITCDVYIGTTEPDDLLPDYGLTKIASGLWGSSAEIPFALDSMQVYYWIVDCWDYNSGSPILLRGPAWKFTTGINPTVLEAEDGLITGPEMHVSSEIEGFSGTGYVAGFNQVDMPNEKVTVSVYAASAGEYPLSLGYRSDYGGKPQYLYVNDVKLTPDPAFPLTDSWDVLDYGEIALEEGMNTITISTYWGYIYLDYFMIQGLQPAATSPNPAHLATAGTSLARLCWKNPEPGTGDTITCDVYFGEEPNELMPYDNYGLPQIASGISGSCVDVPVALQMSHEYYWVVNCWDSEGGSPVLLRGGLWNFKTGNTAPVIDMGPNQQVWLGQDGTPGQVTAEVDASVTDDGLPAGTLTYEWTQTDGPAVVIDPDDEEDISVTFTEIGDYGFRLTAGDTALSVSDTVWVSVRETPCQAAQASSAYQAYKGDLDDNCYVDLSDFAILAMDWLKCADPEGCQ